ncbi:MAG TPA: DUF2846 domain-containing protein [Burkholderiales bacterium]|jgi:hypothetical protein|nr:DUF2846 domain-containing protein [Burkholderiales bacterium]
MRKACMAIWVLSLVALVAGCASPTAAPERDSAAKSFIVQPGKANIYIYRDEQIGLLLNIPVALDGQYIGDTGAQTFLLREVSPGRHTVDSKIGKEASVTIDAQAGRNYFIWQEVKFGPYTILHEIDETKGRAAVATCKLVEFAR